MTPMIWEQVKKLQGANKKLRAELVTERNKVKRVVVEKKNPVIRRGMSDSKGKTWKWVAGERQCFVCHKELNGYDAKSEQQIYLVDSWTKVVHVCSKECDIKFRKKCTDQMSGHPMTMYGFENGLQVKEVNPIKPYVDFTVHKKEVLDRPWNDPVKLEKEMREEVKKLKGEIINDTKEKKECVTRN